MKILVLTLVLCSFSGAAIAQTAECRSIPKSSDRLACYDKAAPPIAKQQKSGTAIPPTADQGQFVDRLAVENAQLDAKIKNICRGC
jgi:hypothetical protein